MRTPRRPQASSRPAPNKRRVQTVTVPKRPPPTPSAAPPPPPRRSLCRRWWWVLLLLFLLIIVYFSFFRPPPPSPLDDLNNSAHIYIDNDDLWQPDAIVQGDNGQILEMKFGN